MENIIVTMILIILIGGASVYIYRAKKKGQPCIGCPYAKTCDSHACGCHTTEKRTKK